VLRGPPVVLHTLVVLSPFAQSLDWIAQADDAVFAMDVAQKLGVHSKLHAVVHAYRNQLI